MAHGTDLVFDYGSPAVARVVERSVAVEAGDIEGSRSDASVSRDGATVTVTVARGGETISEETVSLDADERRELDPGIDTAGEYELTVSVEDGPDRTVSLPIDAFDVRQGSNVIVELGDDVEVLIEE